MLLLGSQDTTASLRKGRDAEHLRPVEASLALVLRVAALLLLKPSSAPVPGCCCLAAAAVVAADVAAGVEWLEWRGGGVLGWCAPRLGDAQVATAVLEAVVGWWVRLVQRGAAVELREPLGEVVVVVRQGARLGEECIWHAWKFLVGGCWEPVPVPHGDRFLLQLQYEALGVAGILASSYASQQLALGGARGLPELGRSLGAAFGVLAAELVQQVLHARHAGEVLRKEVGGVAIPSHLP